MRVVCQTSVLLHLTEADALVVLIRVGDIFREVKGFGTFFSSQMTLWTGVFHDTGIHDRFGCHLGHLWVRSCQFL